MKKQEILDLYANLDTMGNLTGVKFAYAVARNKALLKPEVDAINKAVEPHAEYTKYDEQRIKIAESYSRKDAEGKPMIQAQQYMIDPKKREAFDVAIAKFKKENKKVLDNRQKQVEDWGKLLNETSKIKLHKIKLADVPEGISVGQLNAIYPIIEE